METWFVWLARLMFLGIFLIAGGMLFRAWAIAVRGETRFIADWRGRKIGTGRAWAPFVLAVNLLGGAGLLAVGISTPLLGLAPGVWMGLTALLLWAYYLTLQLASRRASHPAP